MSADERQLNVSDALGYLDAVKQVFSTRTEVYNIFLDIMKDFKSNLIDTPGVIDRVAELFKGHAVLIHGFNTFLPVGYRIDLTGAHTIRITTPKGESTRDTNTNTEHTDMDPAMQYVKTVKARYAAQPDTYRAFLEILSSHTKGGSEAEQAAVSARVDALFADAPDLARAFREFIPGAVAPPPPPVEEHKRRREDPPTSSKRRRKDPAPPAKGKARASAAPKRAAEPSSNAFFARVRRNLASRESYLEFLKLANLFAQGRIDRARLLVESRAYLSDELMDAWKRVLGWSEADDVRSSYAAQRSDGMPAPAFDAGAVTDGGGAWVGSYRKVPEAEQAAPCSGRDELCRSVLNDTWASAPRAALDEYAPSSTAARPPNAYEDALHRTEEERHEYDFHLDALARTTALLEPLVAKINALPPTQRAAFKLKPNLGGAGKAVHARVIRKVYGAEAAPDVLAAMQDVPGIALPTVYQRLRIKEAAWRRAQVAWARVWRAADARNAPRALDARAAAFKAADKKAFTPRAFIAQIEACAAEQARARAQGASALLGARAPSWQMAFALPDEAVLADVLRLLLAYNARAGAPTVAGSTSAAGKNESAARRERAEARAYSLVRALCGLPEGWLGAPSPAPAPHASTSSERPNAKAGDLRKNLLAAAVAAAGAGAEKGRSGTRASSRSPLATPSRGASPAPGPAPAPADNAEAGEPRRVFFVNGWFYVFFRMLETLYSRLAAFKALSAERAKVPGLVAGVPAGQELGPRALYELMLEECERLFDGLLSLDAWEAQARAVWGPAHAFKLFTLDKCLAALLKHLHAFDGAPAHEPLARAVLAGGGAGGRKAAEGVLEEGEPLYRLEWAGQEKVMQVTMLPRGGGAAAARRAEDDARTRWFNYVDAYAAPSPTPGVRTDAIRPPFLRRSLPRAVREKSGDKEREHDGAGLLAAGALEVRVCVRSYRLFYVGRSGEAMWRVGASGESRLGERVGRRREERMKERWGA